jgi:hypothetical protein
MQIKTTKTETIEVTPELLAEAFWEMDARQQADFFNYLFCLTTKEDFEQQMFNCSQLACDDAKLIMSEIGKAAE